MSEDRLPAQGGAFEPAPASARRCTLAARARRCAVTLGALLAPFALVALDGRAWGCDALPVLPEGAQLAQLLDSMHVESHWIAGRHVDWRTGEPDGRPEPREGSHSHCSAFVSAVAAKLDVELLHPPEHSQVFLADAQCAWLGGEGAGFGWRRIASPLEAQQLANRGAFVVACYETSKAELPGHIAIIRPEAVCRRRIETEGPQITQAGVENYASTTLANGFRHHPRAWAHGRAVRFYAHEPVR